MERHFSYNSGFKRTSIGSLVAVFEYDLSNKEECDLGIANAPLTNDLSAWLWVSNRIRIRIVYW